jgi:hypothetical protein
MLSSDFDDKIERWSKIASILLPFVVTLVAGLYTLQKDNNDSATRAQQQARDDYQREWDKTQQQYSNLTSLVPLLTSKDPSAVATGISIYTSEAGAGHAPVDLEETIKLIGNTDPTLTGQVQKAVEATKLQQGSECKFNPNGMYIHVANSTEQLANGQQLAKACRDAGFTVQGVQRVDAAPKATQLRYYFSDANTAEAKKITAWLGNHGFAKIETPNLSPTYLKQGCQPPGIFELWIGNDTSLAINGSPKS